MENLFGELIKEKRLSLGLTLREFCRTKGQDAANISRIENGIVPPPKNKEKLEALALAYEVVPDTAEWVNFFDYAAAANKTISEDLLKNNPNVIHLLPAFCRTARKKKITKKDINDLLEIIKGE